MDSGIAGKWTEQLTEEQHQHLLWLQEHRCSVEAEYAPADPSSGQPEALLLRVIINQHALVKERGTDVPGLFDRVYLAARALLGHGRG